MGSPLFWRRLSPPTRLILVLASVVIASSPLILNWLKYHGAVDRLKSAQAIRLAMQSMALDGITTDDKSIGWPADAKFRSKEEFKAALLKGHYLSPTEMKKLEFDRFEIGNVADGDPGETICLKLQSASYTVVFYRAGDGAILERGKAIPGQEPPRSPAYLPAK